MGLILENGSAGMIWWEKREVGRHACMHSFIPGWVLVLSQAQCLAVEQNAEQKWSWPCLIAWCKGHKLASSWLVLPEDAFASI